MSARFKHDEFNLEELSDVERYEKLMQYLLVDNGGQIVHRSENWTKEGDHIVCIDYIDSDDGTTRW